jgi:transcription elongation factor GreA
VSEENGSTPLSDEARDRLAAELAELRQRRDRLAAELQGDQDTVGDHGDAADAIQRADEVAAIDDRITELNWLLHGGVPVSEAPGRLPDGAELTLRFPDEGVVHMRVVAIPEEASVDTDEATLTADSPLGLALAGHQPGDTVTFSTPQGQQRVELLAAKYPNERAR